MSYFVWLEYYSAAPISKNVKSDEHKYGSKHTHGAQPTQNDIDQELPSLYANVSKVFAEYNTGHPHGIVPYPGNEAVNQNKIVKTRSTKD